MEFKEYDVVQVVQLLHSPEYYDGWKLNKRPPKIGDEGTLLNIATAPDLPTHFIVEAASEDGDTDWLGEFVEEELELVWMFRD